MKPFLMFVMVCIIVWAFSPPADARGRQASNGCSACAAAGTCTPAKEKMWPFPPKPTVPPVVVLPAPAPVVAPCAPVCPCAPAVAACAAVADEATAVARKPLRRLLVGVVRGVGKAVKGTAKIASVAVGRQRRLARRGE